MSKIVFCYSQLEARLYERGVTRSQLANDIGMSERYLAKILDNGLPFKIRYIKSICGTLHIDNSDIGQYFFIEQFDHNEPCESGS